MEDLFSNKTTVEITVVKINNQKLTKSIINQLDYKFPIEKNGNFYDGLKILGYVKHKLVRSDQQIIFTLNNNFYYCPLNTLKELSNIKASSNDYNSLRRLNFDFLDKYENKDNTIRDEDFLTVGYLSFEEFLDSEDLETFSNAISELNEVCKEIKERLIII